TFPHESRSGTSSTSGARTNNGAILNAMQYGGASNFRCRHLLELSSHAAGRDSGETQLKHDVLTAKYAWLGGVLDQFKKRIVAEIIGQGPDKRTYGTAGARQGAVDRVRRVLLQGQHV